MRPQSASTPKRTLRRPISSTLSRLLPAWTSSAVSLAFLACTVYYLLWRVSILNWRFWWIGVPLLLAEMFGIFNSLGLLYTVWPRPAPVIQDIDDPALFPIYILIPTVNEGAGVLEPTLRGALSTRARYLEQHPQAEVTIVVCNDGRVANVADWVDAESLAERLGVICITRTIPGGAKAGNIEHARQAVGATGNALIALFDADMVAEPDFLRKTVAPFTDPTVGWVQTGQYYRNQESAVARWAHDQQILFYKLICAGKAAVNGAFICGTNVVIRAAALDSIGGLPQNTVTEDLAASILLHPAWRGLYLTDVLALGLGPEDLGAYFTQQRRWATGTFGVLFRHWRVMLLPWHRGLTGPQRLQYLYCCAHFFSGFRDLVCLAAPLVYLCAGIPAFLVFSFPAFLIHFLPYWAFSLFVFWYATRGKAGFRAVLHGSILGFGCFPLFLSAFLTALFQRRIRFMITAKRRQRSGLWRHLTPQIVTLAACILAMGRFAWAGNHGWLGLVSEMWMLYVVLLVSGMLWLGAAENPEMERKMRRAVARSRPVLIAVLTVAAGLFVSQQVLGRIQLQREPPAASASALRAEGSVQPLTFQANTHGQVVGITNRSSEGDRDLSWPFHLIPFYSIPR